MFRVHFIWFGKIANVNNVGIQRLVHCRIKVLLEIKRQNHRFFDFSKHVRDQSERAQLSIDVSKQGLILVERHETYLGVHGHGVCEVRTSTAKDRELRTLDIDFEKIEGSDFGTNTTDEFFDDLFRLTSFRTDPALSEVSNPASPDLG